VKVLRSPQYAEEETQLFIVKKFSMTAYLLTQQLNKMYLTQTHSTNKGGELEVEQGRTWKK